MSLINCPECGKQVSDKAPTCPNCGVPIAQAADQADGTPLVTTQETAKPLKLQYALSGVALFLAICLVGIGFATESHSLALVGGLATVMALIWCVIVNVRIWWHHA